MTEKKWKFETAHVTWYAQVVPRRRAWIKSKATANAKTLYLRAPTRVISNSLRYQLG